MYRPVVVAMVLWGLINGSASAEIVRVPTEEPTIQTGINAAGDGDTILVAPGNYQENLVAGDLDFTLLSESGSAVTVLEPALTAHPILRIEPSLHTMVCVGGFTLRGVDSVKHTAIYARGVDLVLIGNLLTDNREGAVYLFGQSGLVADSNVFAFNRSNGRASGVFCTDFTRSELTRNYFIANTGGDFGQGGGAGITLLEGGSCSIRQNVFIANYTTDVGGAVSIVDVDTVVVRNNTADSNTADLGAGIYLTGYVSAALFNNIVVGSHSGAPGSGVHIDLGPAAPLVDFNDAWDNASTDYSGPGGLPGPNSISADPSFTGGNPVDYRLGPASPCRDAGHPDVVFNDPDGSRSDIGATPSIDDRDFDGIRDSLDVCFFDPLNDVDSDGVCGEVDNCEAVPNPEQTDSDLDGTGDVCDPCPFDHHNDWDSDGFCGDLDNCPYIFNPDQTDSDADGVGDACECSCPWHTDINGDGVHDAVDLAFTIDCVFFGCPDVQDPMCPTNRHDFNADGFADATDLALLIDYVFFGQDVPCDPCNPVQPTCAP